MVHSLMSNASFPDFFWGYALEMATFILNRTSSKSIQKTPYEIWFGRRSNLSFINIWDCETYVNRLSSDKCFFLVGYPKEIREYYFYYLTESKVFVARTAVFLKREFIFQGTSGRKLELG